MPNFPNKLPEIGIASNQKETTNNKSFDIRKIAVRTIVVGLCCLVSACGAKDQAKAKAKDGDKEKIEKAVRGLSISADILKMSGANEDEKDLMQASLRKLRVGLLTKDLPKTKAALEAIDKILLDISKIVPRRENPDIFQNKDFIDIHQGCLALRIHLRKELELFNPELKRLVKAYKLAEVKTLVLEDKEKIAEAQQELIDIKQQVQKIDALKKSFAVVADRSQVIYVATTFSQALAEKHPHPEVGNQSSYSVTDKDEKQHVITLLTHEKTFGMGNKNVHVSHTRKYTMNFECEGKEWPHFFVRFNEGQWSVQIVPQARKFSQADLKTMYMIFTTPLKAMELLVHDRRKRGPIFEDTKRIIETYAACAIVEIKNRFQRKEK